jgi:hypothetical protein
MPIHWAFVVHFHESVPQHCINKVGLRYRYIGTIFFSAVCAWLFHHRRFSIDFLKCHWTYSFYSLFLETLFERFVKKMKIFDWMKNSGVWKSQNDQLLQYPSNSFRSLENESSSSNGKTGIKSITIQNTQHIVLNQVITSIVKDGF